MIAKMNITEKVIERLVKVVSLFRFWVLLDNPDKSRAVRNGDIKLVG